MTRGERGKSSLRAFNVQIPIPLPSKNDILNHIGNKKQLINVIVSELIDLFEHTKFSNNFVVTCKEEAPIQIQDGIVKDEWSVSQGGRRYPDATNHESYH